MALGQWELGRRQWLGPGASSISLSRGGQEVMPLPPCGWKEEGGVCVCVCAHEILYFCVFMCSYICIAPSLSLCVCVCVCVCGVCVSQCECV